MLECDKLTRNEERILAFIAAHQKGGLTSGDIIYSFRLFETGKNYLTSENYSLLNLRDFGYIKLDKVSTESNIDWVVTLTFKGLWKSYLSFAKL